MKKPYKPSQCKGDKSLFTGNVVLRMPAYEERMELLCDAELLDLADEEGQTKGDKKKQLKSMLQLVKASYAFYEKVEIKRRSDSKEYKKLDDLRFNSECAEILQDVAMYLINGGGSTVEGKL